MKLLVLEDEEIVNKRICGLISSCFQNQSIELVSMHTLEDAKHYIETNTIDLLFLDLNLNGKDGFSLLAEMVAQCFQTIIISANTDRAIQAFEYGVLDFIPKPVNKHRLESAIQRYLNQGSAEQQTKYLAVRNHPQTTLINVDSVMYIKGAGNYSEIFTESEVKELHNKPLDQLSILLPKQFLRIHKSYIVNRNYCTSFLTEAGSKYQIVLKDNTHLPISRKLFKTIKEYLSN